MAQNPFYHQFLSTHTLRTVSITSILRFLVEFTSIPLYKITKPLPNLVNQGASLRECTKESKEQFKKISWRNVAERAARTGIKGVFIKVLQLFVLSRIEDPHRFVLNLPSSLFTPSLPPAPHRASIPSTKNDIKKEVVLNLTSHQFTASSYYEFSFFVVNVSIDTFRWNRGDFDSTELLKRFFEALATRIGSLSGATLLYGAATYYLYETPSEDTNKKLAIFASAMAGSFLGSGIGYKLMKAITRRNEEEDDDELEEEVLFQKRDHDERK
eukprot:TRINITY_DN5479_c0_g1_i1.p1 TRINITY_DN5479_c0_g1~~TRINITY_DN5479_c0_g1_i1.p1  ORF type:complete len:270 (-),score=28.69 TRINITY_DN5479_c0_g1_i1:71-880(-)